MDHIACTVHVQGGWTPLFCAAERGHENVAEVLLKAEASVDTPDKVHLLLMIEYFSFLTNLGTF